MIPLDRMFLGMLGMSAAGDHVHPFFVVRRSLLFTSVFCQDNVIWGSSAFGRVVPGRGSKVGCTKMYKGL